MLQVARLSPKQLGDARDLVQHFLLEQRHPDGGFQDRSGDPDLYYTVFGLEGLVALQAEPPIEALATYLSRFGAGDNLDFVHVACLARAWATVGGFGGGNGLRALMRLRAMPSRRGSKRSEARTAATRKRRARRAGRSMRRF